MIPLVAIVGRPNVGKSTLFNRLVRRRQAIVQDDPGVTRDRHYGVTAIEDRQVQLVDTGGFVRDAATPIEVLIREQAQIAVDEADVIVLVMDVRQGLTPEDRELDRLLRRTGKPLLHVANKVDGAKQEQLVGEFYELGARQVLGVSAEHALGLDELHDALLDAIPPPEAGPEADGEGAAGIRVALVGRPNAGKSSLFNALVGQNRAIVSDEPGTTRDPVDLELDTAEGRFVLVDTAGIRRKRTKSTTMERYAIVRGMRAITSADVACLVMDSAVGPTEQDARLANMAEEAGRGLVLVLTKIDLVPRGGRGDLTAQVDERLSFVDYAPRVLVSSLNGQGLKRLLPAVRRAHEGGGLRVPTAELNRFLEQALAAHAPPSYRGKGVRFYYITQPRAHPPTFIASTSAPRGVPESYRRYLLNRLRERYGFEGSPLRLFLRAHRPPKQ